MDLLALAARSAEPGYLIHAGRVPTTADLTRMTGIRRSTLESAIKELEAAEVFSRDARGAIYSRRMVREADAYRRAVEAGSQGGNPMLLSGERDADTDHARTVSGADADRPRTVSVPQTERIRSEETNGSNELSGKGVNPPVKIDKDLDKEEEKKGNPDGFPDPAAPSDGATVVHLEAARKAATKQPARRGVERVPPIGSPQQLQDEDRALQLWNALAAVSNPAVGRMTPDRRAKLRKRLKEAGGLAGWQRALQAVEASDLWQGRVGRGWVPCFDDILSPTKFRKLLEGGYANPTQRPGRGRPDPNDDLYARLGLGLGAGAEVDADDGAPTLDMEDV